MSQHDGWIVSAASRPTEEQIRSLVNEMRRVSGEVIDSPVVVIDRRCPPGKLYLSRKCDQ